MNGSDAPPASTVNKITWSRYVTLDSLISSPLLAGGATDPFMLPPCMLRHEDAAWKAASALPSCTSYVSLPVSILPTVSAVYRVNCRPSSSLSCHYCMYIYHLISIVLQSSCSVNSHTLQSLQYRSWACHA